MECLKGKRFQFLGLFQWFCEKQILAKTLPKLAFSWTLSKSQNLHFHRKLLKWRLSASKFCKRPQNQSCSILFHSNAHDITSWLLKILHLKGRLVQCTKTILFLTPKSWCALLVTPWYITHNFSTGFWNGNSNLMFCVHLERGSALFVNWSFRKEFKEQHQSLLTSTFKQAQQGQS